MRHPGHAWDTRRSFVMLRVNLGGRPNRVFLVLYCGFRALLRARLCMARPGSEFALVRPIPACRLLQLDDPF